MTSILRMVGRVMFTSGVVVGYIGASSHAMAFVCVACGVGDYRPTLGVGVWGGPCWGDVGRLGVARVMCKGDASSVASGGVWACVEWLQKNMYYEGVIFYGAVSYLVVSVRQRTARRQYRRVGNGSTRATMACGDCAKLAPLYICSYGDISQDA